MLEGIKGERVFPEENALDGSRKYLMDSGTFVPNVELISWICRAMHFQ